MIIPIHPDNPDPRKVREVVNILRKDGVIVLPTDTVYSFACSLGSSKGFDRIARIKGLRPNKAHFSILCADLSDLSNYTRPVPNEVYKLMKRALPGPFTFILQAGGNIPKLFRSTKKTIGIRVPDNGVAQAVIREIGMPLVVSSVHDEDDVLEYTTDPELISERHGHAVNAVINGGFGELYASTIIDCTSGIPEVIREGRGDVSGLI
ncbi:MAG TPA: threonylcarbamoyl-AMP synthase [Flavobacteriales bacterium]|nr:threonylcarbamoyl-AMP synthase [Flavobacteriales bacterium]HIB77862.1 threonylcarbamoyl-AMP synthase [Flavobacteriales bacterium]HIN41670.1 threonylcarbamoyl-AMP synthase [Flavobacteriales bacterium]HIO15306.1 threonylcarbamoyl-AMP synthase [Flavobacteriales bacterium]HIO59597.1 threonylcarbamoyl-AMP synthase [Flavobacteriales bacterium]